MKCPQCASEVWAGFDGFVRCKNGDRLSNAEYNALTLEEQQKADGTWQEPTYTLEEARALLAAQNAVEPVAEPEPEPAAVLAHPDILDVEVPPAEPVEMDAAPPVGK